MTISKSNIIGWSGFVVMTIAFLLLRNCKGNDVCGPIAKDTITVAYYDSVPKEILVTKPYPVPGKEIIIEVPANIDTAAILKDYYTKFYYSDTIADSTIRVVVNDSVYKNKILDRSFTYQILKPFITNTILPTQQAKPKIGIYAGGFASGKIDGTNIGIGFSAMLKTKKEIVYDVGFDVINQRAQFGVLVTLRRR